MNDSVWPPNADVSTEEFIRVMITNAFSPPRVVETFQDLVLPERNN